VPVEDTEQPFTAASEDMRFATAVAAFGMLLRDSKYSGSAKLDGVIAVAEKALGDDPHGYRLEFLDLARRAKTAGDRRGQPALTDAAATASRFVEIEAQSLGEK